jgi:hypothetical protein
LVLFENQPPDLAWHPMPLDWKMPNGLVELRVARGTLVPPTLHKGLVPSVAPMRLKAEPNNQEGPPVVATQAESLDHPLLSAISTFDNDDENGDGDDGNGDDDDCAWMSDAVARKRALRMKRNRQSAATSRDRKRRYICDLEQQVDELTATVKTLREENSLLSLLNLQPVQNVLDDRSSPVSIDAPLFL